MARKEIDIENYLVERVEFWGGTCQKLDVRGHRGRCDRVVAFPHAQFDPPMAVVFFIELKRRGEKPESYQEREHARLKELGLDVRVIDSVEGVNSFIQEVIGSLQ